ncbi:MAG: ABC transporter permease [Inquilinaceae bacterium]
MSRDGTRAVVAVSGRWDLRAALDLDRRVRLAAGEVTGVQTAAIDLGAVSALDTAGAWLLQRTRSDLRARGVDAGFANATPAQLALLEAVETRSADCQVQERRPNKLVEIAERVGKATFAFIGEAMSLLNFLGMVCVRLAGVVVHPGRLRLTSTVHHMEMTGLNAMPIVGLLAFLIGVVLAYQSADQLRQFGAEIFVVNLLGVSVLRELGILITAIIVAGRSGSAFTAQIGTMKVNEEVDALQTLGLDPVDVLVLPRILALVATLPLLAFYANIMALAGGAVMSYTLIDISFGAFIQQLQSAVTLTTLWVGLIKAPVFGFVIALVGCYEGLKVTRSAESVGRLTTQSVVEAIFLVIVLDALFSVLFSLIGI